jgi:hypothetical protein
MQQSPNKATVGVDFLPKNIIDIIQLSNKKEFTALNNRRILYAHFVCPMLAGSKAATFLPSIPTPQER